MTFLYATFLLFTNIFRIIINFSGPTPPDDYSGSTGNAKNPPYSYFIYHLYANLKVLNRLREAKGFNTLPLKPHAGEAGSRHHMATAFLLGITQRNLTHYLSATSRPFCAAFPPFFRGFRLPGAKTERTGEKWRKTGEIWGRNGRETAVTEALGAQGHGILHEHAGGESSKHRDPQ